jgi:hypothetical protein
MSAAPLPIANPTTIPADGCPMITPTIAPPNMPIAIKTPPASCGFFKFVFFMDYALPLLAHIKQATYDANIESQDDRPISGMQQYVNARVTNRFDGYSMLL